MFRVKDVLVGAWCMGAWESKRFRVKDVLVVGHGAWGHGRVRGLELRMC